MKTPLRVLEYHREYYKRPEQRAKQNARGTKWREANRERSRAASRKSARKLSGAKDPVGDYKCGPCEICKTPTENLRWDHDHATGEFRGWLCHPCNVALGLFRDSPLLLRAAQWVS